MEMEMAGSGMERCVRRGGDGKQGGRRGAGDGEVRAAQGGRRRGGDGGPQGAGDGAGDETENGPSHVIRRVFFG